MHGPDKALLVNHRGSAPGTPNVKYLSAPRFARCLPVDNPAERCAEQTVTVAQVPTTSGGPRSRDRVKSLASLTAGLPLVSTDGLRVRRSHTTRKGTVTDISIPASLAEARTLLAGLDGLITAKEWERAAIVYAFTEPQQGRRTSSGITGSLTIIEFAALGIAGLRSDQTVRRHRQAWQQAIDAGRAEDVFPGNVVALPDLPWGEVYVTERAERGRSDSLELPVTTDEGKLSEWFDRHSDHAARVTKAAAGALTLQEKAALIETLTAGVSPPLPRDHDAPPMPPLPPPPAPSSWLDIVTELAESKRRLENALRLAMSTPLSEPTKEGLSERLGEVQKAVDNVSDYLTGNSLDDELAHIMKGQ